VCSAEWSSNVTFDRLYSIDVRTTVPYTQVKYMYNQFAIGSSTTAVSRVIYLTSFTCYYTLLHFTIFKLVWQLPPFLGLDIGKDRTHGERGMEAWGLGYSPQRDPGTKPLVRS